MALNKQVLQTLDSPRLRPLEMKTLVGLTAGQLRKQIEAEKYEINQLRNQLSIEMNAAIGATNKSTTAPPQERELTERQELVRELQQLRKQKMEIAEQIKVLRANPSADLAKSLKAAEKLIMRKEREKRQEEKSKERAERKRERERKREEKKEERKDKLWNQKNLRKGSISGERAHDRFKRFFDSGKINESDKDRMREMLSNVAFYESDEVFQILSLMESKAFNSTEEAEEFFLDYYHIQKGQKTALDKFRKTKIIDFETAANNMENMAAQDFRVNTGLDLRF